MEENHSYETPSRKTAVKAHEIGYKSLPKTSLPILQKNILGISSELWLVFDLVSETGRGSRVSKRSWQVGSSSVRGLVSPSRKSDWENLKKDRDDWKGSLRVLLPRYKGCEEWRNWALETSIAKIGFWRIAEKKREERGANKNADRYGGREKGRRDSFG